MLFFQGKSSVRRDGTSRRAVTPVPTEQHSLTKHAHTTQQEQHTANCPADDDDLFHRQNNLLVQQISARVCILWQRNHP